MTPWWPARLVTCPGTLSLLQCLGIRLPAPDKPTASPGSRCSCTSNSTEPSRLHRPAQRDGRNRRGLLGAAGSPSGKQHEVSGSYFFLPPSFFPFYCRTRSSEEAEPRCLLLPTPWGPRPARPGAETHPRATTWSRAAPRHKKYYCCSPHDNTFLP